MLISMTVMESRMSEDWQTRRNREDLEVRTAIESFPHQFRLYGFPDCWFRIAQSPSSYYSDSAGVQLVVQIWSTKATWMDFGRFNPTELRGRLTR
jgi:hypothetical protein